MTTKELRDILDQHPDDAEIYVDCIGDRDLSSVTGYMNQYGNLVLRVSRIATLLAEIGAIKKEMGDSE